MKCRLAGGLRIVAVIAILGAAVIPISAFTDPAADNWACDHIDEKLYHTAWTQDEFHQKIYSIDASLAAAIDPTDADELLGRRPKDGLYYSPGKLDIDDEGVAIGYARYEPKDLAFHIRAGFSRSLKRERIWIANGQPERSRLLGRVELIVEKIATKPSKCAEKRITGLFETKDQGIKMLESIVNRAYAFAALGAKSLPPEKVAERYALYRSRWITNELAKLSRTNPNGAPALGRAFANVPNPTAAPYIPGTLPGLATPEETTAYKSP